MSVRYRVLDKRSVSVEALRLAEDMAALRQVQELLRSIDELNIAADAKDGRRELYALAHHVRIWLRYAEAKMRQEFLK